MKMSDMSPEDLRTAVEEASAIPTQILRPDGVEVVIITAERYWELMESHQQHKNLVVEINDVPEIFDKPFK